MDIHRHDAMNATEAQRFLGFLVLLGDSLASVAVKEARRATNIPQPNNSVRLNIPCH